MLNRRWYLSSCSVVIFCNVSWCILPNFTTFDPRNIRCQTKILECHDRWNKILTFRDLIWFKTRRSNFAWILRDCYTFELHRKRQDWEFFEFPANICFNPPENYFRTGQGGGILQRGERYWKFRVFRINSNFRGWDLETTRVKKKKKCPIKLHRLKARLKAFVCSGPFEDLANQTIPKYLESVWRSQAAKVKKVLWKRARPGFQSQLLNLNYWRLIIVRDDWNVQICIKVRRLLIRHASCFIANYFRNFFKQLTFLKNLI